jgi:hypothetical protein
MKKLSLKALLVALLITFLIVGLAVAAGDQPGKPGDPGPPDDSPGNQNPGQNPLKAVPNLSFPIIATDILQMFYEQTLVDLDGDDVYDDGEEWVLTIDETSGDPIPIVVDTVITDDYDGGYDGNEVVEHCAYVVDETTGCPVDWNNADNDGTPDLPAPDGVIDDNDLECVDMASWLSDNEFWYDQPVFYDVEEYAYDPNNIWDATVVDADDIGGANSWQADWTMETENIIYIDFIDWGNPLENINPIVNQRFPVEVALYEKLDTAMIAYKMACLEWPGTNVELFGTSDLDTTDYTYESVFATVLTNKFTAEVWKPNGTIESISISPGIGPSGKMNFASGGGGWIPDMPGWHRIWLHTNDPLISFTGAIVNNDEHYIMTTGCMAQTLNPNKLALTGIIGDSVYIDVLVVSPSGNN